jgi:hypothetical protein
MLWSIAPLFMAALLLLLLLRSIGSGNNSTYCSTANFYRHSSVRYARCTLAVPLYGSQFQVSSVSIDAAIYVLDTAYLLLEQSFCWLLHCVLLLLLL